MIEVHFLGVGAALPLAGHTNSSYLVCVGDVQLLIDCGPAVLQQLAGVGRTPIDVTHLFITHRHGDHALGYPMFALWWRLDPKAEGRTLPTILANTVAWPSLDILWQHTYDELPVPAFPRVSLPTSEPSSHQLTGDVLLKTWPMNHSDYAPVLGVRIEVAGKVLAFTADTAQCDNVVELARGADLLVHDANYSATMEPMKPDDSPVHSTARVAGKNAQAAGVKNLALVHVGAQYAGKFEGLVAEARSVCTANVFLPVPGQVVTLQAP